MVVFIGIHCNTKGDIGRTAVELVYGTSVCLPGELLYLQPAAALSTYSVKRLWEHMVDVRFTPTRKQQCPEQKQSKLSTHSSVSVNNDAPLKPLQPAHDDPYK